VQINGKWRAEIAAPKAASKDELAALARGIDDVERHLAGATPKRVVVVPGRLVNFVV
jgi:leucyl-tRNA synthetase